MTDIADQKPSFLLFCQENCRDDILSQWHPTKNGTLSPLNITAGSSRKVWWRCEKGHEWRAKVVDRTRNQTGCPYCTNQKVLAGFNDLATLEPDIASQWNYDLNGSLTPQMITPGSSRKVWWSCSQGHTWRTAVYNRTGHSKRTGCPVCSGAGKAVLK